MITSLVLFFIAGIMALVIRAQLATPDLLVGQLPDLQRAVHHARQPHALPVRRALRLRWAGQLHRAAAGGRPRHGLPPAQRPVVLAVPGRLDHHDVRVPGGRRGGQLRLGGLRPAVQRHQLPGGRRRPVADGPGPHRVLGHLHRGQPVRHHLLPAGPGDDHVPGAHLLVEHAGHRHPHPDRLPRAVRRGGHAVLRPPLRHPHLHRAGRRCARCCGRTSSGSSAIPRSTSWPCPTSAWSPTSSRCSPASRCSATRGWSSPPCPSPPCPPGCGPTTCSPPAWCCCPSSRCSPT